MAIALTGLLNHHPSKNHVSMSQLVCKRVSLFCVTQLKVKKSHHTIILPLDWLARAFIVVFGHHPIVNHVSSDKSEFKRTIRLIPSDISLKSHHTNISPSGIRTISETDVQIKLEEREKEGFIDQFGFNNTKRL
jgi:hypothetical protein